MRKDKSFSEFDELASPSSPAHKIYNSVAGASYVFTRPSLSCFFFVCIGSVASPDASLPLAESITFACPYATAFSGDNTRSRRGWWLMPQISDRFFGSGKMSQASAFLLPVLMRERVTNRMCACANWKTSSLSFVRAEGFLLIICIWAAAYYFLFGPISLSVIAPAHNVTSHVNKWRSQIFLMPLVSNLERTSLRHTKTNHIWKTALQEDKKIPGVKHIAVI